MLPRPYGARALTSPAHQTQPPEPFVRLPDGKIRGMKPFHIQIWQAQMPDFFAERLPRFPDGNHQHVADVQVIAPDLTMALEGAFRLTQHGLHRDLPNWTQGRELTFLHHKEARSTSVGDVFVVDGQAFGVLNVGFSPLART